MFNDHTAFEDRRAKKQLLRYAVKTETAALVETDGWLIAIQYPKSKSGISGQLLDCGIHQRVAYALMLIFLQYIQGIDFTGIRK